MAKRSWNDWKAEKKKTKVKALKNWKEDGEVTVWLHTNSCMYQKGKHTVPYVFYDKEKNENKITWFNFNCHEDDEFVKWKSKDPEHCPLDLFVSWLKEQDDIEDDEIVWECIIGKRSKNNVQLTKYDITTNWKTRFVVKSKSVLAVINDKDVDAGITVTEEPVSIENGIFKAISNYEKKLERSGKDPDFADPDIKPYPFLWEFNSSATKAEDYYNVIALDEVEPSKKVLELLESDEIDLSNWTKPGKSKMLRKIMEDHIVLEDVPFDEFFANTKDDYQDDDEEEEVKETPPPKAKRTRKVKTVKKEKVKEEVEEETVEDDEDKEDVLYCDECERELPPGSEDLEVCPFCQK